MTCPLSRGRAMTGKVRAGILVLLALGVVMLASCAGSSSNTPTPQPPQSAQPGDVISWGEAGSSIGQKLTVEGAVTHVGKGRGPHGPALVVDVGADPSDPGRFMVVIPKKVADRLTVSERERLPGAFVRVTGKIVTFKGVATIVARSPAQIRIR